MKIISGTPVAGAPAAGAASETAVLAAATPPSSTSAPSGSQGLQSAVLQPALEAARQTPDVDHAKVAELRDALARGALPFDAAKLAALIERYHRNDIR